MPIDYLSKYSVAQYQYIKDRSSASNFISLQEKKEFIDRIENNYTLNKATMMYELRINAPWKKQEPLPETLARLARKVKTKEVKSLLNGDNKRGS